MWKACKWTKHCEEAIQCQKEFTTRINSVWSSGVLAQEAAEEKSLTGASLQCRWKNRECRWCDRMVLSQEKEGGMY